MIFRSKEKYLFHPSSCAILQNIYRWIRIDNSVGSFTFNWWWVTHKKVRSITIVEVEGITEKDRYICSHSEQQIHRSLSLSAIYHCYITLQNAARGCRAAVLRSTWPCWNGSSERSLSIRSRIVPPLRIDTFFFFFLFFWIFLLNVDIGNISRLNDLESLSYFSLFKYNIASINIFMIRKFFEISKKSFSRQNLLRK